jgi:hypothetical protein
VPLQVTSFNNLCLDREFCVGLDKGLSANSQVIRNLSTALSFFALANTDNEVMLPEAEIILMGSAFEQLFHTEGAYKLCRKFGALFKPCGTVTVQQALSNRPGIAIDPEPETRQKQWFVHRKWIEELYKLRSGYIHGNSITNRSWGWEPYEHLVMGAYVFPLTVKILLSREGHCSLSEEDTDRCRAIDRLLSKVHWKYIPKNNNSSIWQTTLAETYGETMVQDPTEQEISLLNAKQRGGKEPE